MRSVSDSITNAITIPESHRQSGKLTVYKSRAYFDALTSNNPSSDARDIGFIGTPLNESSFLLSPASRPEIAHTVITVYVTDENVLYLMIEGNATPILLLTEVDVTCHVGCNANNTTGIYSLYYYSITNSQWEYQHIDINLLLSGSACLTGVVTSFPELPKGSIYPLDGTANSFVLLDIYEGSVRVRIYDDNKDTVPNQYRFVNPIKTLNPLTADAYLLHRAGAVLVGNKVYVYFSHYDGCVKSMICTLQADMRHGTWSDIRISIPQDISIFNINNVFQNNGRIFISGSFYRTSQFASSIVYALLTWSDDGLTFTMNRRVLSTLMNLPFQCHTDGVDVVFASTNRIYKTAAPYQLIGENAQHTVVDLLSISGSVSSEITATAVSGSEQYFDDDNIDTGSYAKLETTIETTLGVESIKYMDCVISGIDKNIKDGGRGNTIALMSDANWHTSVMTQPFYMEFQGQQSIFDRCLDFSNLYAAASGINPDWFLGADFWETGGLAFTIKTHNNASNRHWTKDLSDLYTEYPVFGALDNYVVNIYGWSRAGVPDTIPNTIDPTNITTLNDKFYPVVEYEDVSGVRHIWVGNDSNLIAPTYNHAPQIYFQAHAGSYPCVYAMPNPGAGFKITHLGVDVVSQSADNTTYYLERIDMVEITASMIVNSVNVATFDLNNYITTVDGKSIITKYLFNKRKGVPQLLFSTKPYSAFNFECTARLNFKGQFTQCGLLGLATDSKNFIAGYIMNGYARLIQVKNGVTTVLQELSITVWETQPYDVRLWHRDGIIGFEYKVNSDIAWPERGSILRYEWAAGNGNMALVDDIFHVGVYSFIDSPHFRITGMKVGETIVAAMPGDVNNVGLFPTSGRVDIDGMIYTYTGSTSHFTIIPALGPYQIKSVLTQNYPFNRERDGSFLYQGGGAIEFSASKPLPGITNSSDYVGAIIATSSGHAWVNEQTQWKSWTQINGVPVNFTDRARMYSSGITPLSVSANDRVYVTDGLTGLVAVDKVKETAGEKEATQMNTFMHCPGVFAYYDANDIMNLYGFSAASGDHSQSIHHLIDLFCKLAGTNAEFLGDWKSMQTLTDGTEINLYD